MNSRVSSSISFHLKQWGQLSHSNPEPTNLVSLAHQITWGSLSLPPMCWVITRVPFPRDTDMDAGDLKSSPHACVASALTTDPSFTSPKFIFLSCFHPLRFNVGRERQPVLVEGGLLWRPSRKLYKGQNSEPQSQTGTWHHRAPNSIILWL